MEKKLNGFHLKLIAIIAMFINHLGHGFNLNEYSDTLFFFTELIGKLTFPIMAYLLVEGFHYTKSVKKYGLRLAAFWLLSIYPFHWLNYPNLPFTPIELVNNIFFTLLIGLCLIYLYEKTNNMLLHIDLVILFSLFTVMSDWNLIGVLLIFGFYRIKQQKLKIIVPVIYTTLFLFTLIFIAYLYVPESAPLYIAVSTLGVLLTIPILLNYNGQRGYSYTWVKWGFYLFYPFHMIALAIVKMWLF